MPTFVYETMKIDSSDGLSGGVKKAAIFSMSACASHACNVILKGQFDTEESS